MSNPTTPSAWGIQLSKLWMACGQKFPINVKEIVFEVVNNKFPDDPIGIIKGHGISGIDGILAKRKSKGDWGIYYDEMVSVPGRTNFTLGHELGHYLLHRTLSDKFQCGQNDVLNYGSVESKKIESEANKFASYLLMPANDFRDQITGQEVTLDLLGHCSDRYGTSFTATALKWIEITDKAALLVVARDDFICWSYPSRLAKKRGVYFPPGTPVPESTIERLSKIFGGIQRNQNCRVKKGVWHSKMEANEAIIISDNFDLSIFLIQFPLARGIVEQEEDDVQDSFTFLSDRAKGLNWVK